MADPTRSVSAQRLWLPLAALIAGNIALTFGAVFVRLSDTGPVAAGFWRMALALPVLAALAVREHRAAIRTQGHAPAIGWGPALAGVFFAADLAAWHSGIPLTRIANSTLFGNSSSLFLVLFTILVLRQRPTMLQIAALALAVIGSVLLFGDSLRVSPDSFTGDMLCILAGLLYTAYLLLVQRARTRGVGPWRILLVSSAVTAPLLLVTSLALGERVMPIVWWPLIALFLSSQIVGQGLATYAIPHFTPLVVGLSLLLQPAIGALIGWWLFNETLGPVDVVAMVIIGAALVLAQMTPRPAPSAAPAPVNP